MGFQHGLSGLNAAKQNLDVIGHNIANANTTGFKGSRAEFAAIIAGAMGVSNSGNADGVQTAVVAQQLPEQAITRVIILTWLSAATVFLLYAKRMALMPTPARVILSCTMAI